MANFNDVLTFTRASSAWWVEDGVLNSAAVDIPRFTVDGILVEDASTNVFLNSDTPASQEVFVNAGEKYTISCYGEGSLTAETAGDITKGDSSFSWDASTTSPEGVIEITEDSPVTITAITTSFSMNVNSPISYAQVETGEKKTSFIVTEASPVTRVKESLSTKEA